MRLHLSIASLLIGLLSCADDVGLGTASGGLVANEVVDFGLVPVGEQARATLTLSNTAGRDLEVTVAALPSRVVSALGSTLRIQRGASAVIELTWHPTEAGALAAPWEFTTDDGQTAITRLAGIAQVQVCDDGNPCTSDAFDAALVC